MVTLNPASLENMALMDGESESAGTSDVTNTVAILKRRWWLLVLLPLLLACCAYTLTSLLLKPSYNATATLLVSPIGAPSGNPSNDVTAATLLSQTYSALVTSPPILQAVVTDLHLKETPAQLASLVTVTAEPSSAVIRIATKYPSPEGAAAISNAVGDHFITFLAGLQKAGATQSSQALRDSVNKARADRDAVSAQLAALQAAPGTPTPEEAAQIAALQSLREQYQSIYSSLLDLQQRTDIAQLTTQNAVSLAVRAVPPQRPARSLRLLATVGALLGGLGLAVVGTVVAEQASPRVRAWKDIRRLSAAPMLAAIPPLRAKEGIEVIRRPRSAASEAIHSLRTKIWLEARAREGTIITVAHPEAGDDASLVAANLAVAFAQAGKRVTLVDGNLRHPSLWKVFGKDRKYPGLAELVAVPRLTFHEVLAPGPHPDLRLLLAGPVSPIASERLTTERLDEIIAELRQRADVVIISAPPLLTDADSVLFLTSADYAVMVGRANHTRMSALEAALASVDALRVRLLGLILSDAERDDSAA